MNRTRNNHRRFIDLIIMYNLQFQHLVNPHNSLDDTEAIIDEDDGIKTFAQLVCVSDLCLTQYLSQGVCDVLCETCERLGWKMPTKIQISAIPSALNGRDVIGLAETGSGKTGAFALPILQTLLERAQKLYALVLTPTRELAFQIAEQFQALGTCIGIRVGT